ncbi:MAG: hypothetical protein M3Q56_11645 [Bacteroidota bacterium]|nr:hypothetical protein [Bacteroidota bacterium]
MIRLTLSFFILLLVLQVNAQYSGFVEVASNTIDYKNQESRIPDSMKIEFPYLAYKLGISYWFRLKKFRIEFLPGLAYSYAKSTYLNSQVAGEKVKETQYSVELPILLYPFDFKNDCNCPTFKKSGSILKKGMYFILQPSLLYSDYDFNRQNGSHKYWLTQLDLGVGLDFAITKIHTLSPSIQYARVLNNPFNTKLLDTELGLQSVNHSKISVNLRWISRFDYKKK